MWSEDKGLYMFAVGLLWSVLVIIGAAYKKGIASLIYISLMIIYIVIAGLWD